MRTKPMLRIFGICLALAMVSACATAPGPTTYDGQTGQIQDIIANGAVNTPDENGLTPLMAAAAGNNADGITILLQNGANIDARDAKGRSALAHAFDKGNTAAFKTLMENGARLDMASGPDAAAKSPQQAKLYRMTREYSLVSKIRARNTDLKAYDRYFSLFFNGHYSPEVESMLHDVVKTEYKRISNSNSAASWRKFMKRYRHIGQHAYEITVDKLNVRKRDTKKAKKTGSYDKGEIVFGKAQRHGWILTDKGWISGMYTKPMLHNVRVLEPYLRGARDKIRQLDRPVKRVKPKPVVKKQKPKPIPAPKPMPVPKPEPATAPEPLPMEIEKPVAPVPEIEEEVDSVKTEYDRVMNSGTEAELLKFIQTHINDPEHEDLVKQARTKYILMIRKNK